MHAYFLKKGRQGYLVLPNGELRDYRLKEDKMFLRDDSLVDPIRLYNARNAYKDNPRYLGVNEWNPQQAKALELAEQGYTTFGVRGNKTDTIYGFAVIITEMDSEFD